jgi:transcriptional regulator with XRE-family HTH domain
MAIRYRLKELRMARRMSQAEIAEQMGLKLGTYRNYEQGLRELNGETLIRFAEYYQVSTDYILGRDVQKLGLLAASRKNPVQIDLSEDGRRQVREFIDFVMQKEREKRLEEEARRREKSVGTPSDDSQRILDGILDDES